MPYTDSRWSSKSAKPEKLYGVDAQGAQKKFLVHSSDEDTDDDEWIQQLERDYGKRQMKKQKWKKWSRLEKMLLVSLLFSLLVTCLMFSAFLYSRHKHGETFVEFALGGQGICSDRACVEASHRVLTYLDEHSDPCHSLYDYACGRWMREKVSQSEHSRLTSFKKVSDDNLSRLKNILENLKVGEEDSTALKKVFRYYHACKNQALNEKQANESVISLINFVGTWAITNASSWNGEMWSFGQALTRIHRLKSMPLFYMSVATDEANSTRNVIKIEQSGVTMADHEHYTKGKDDKVVSAYKKMMVEVALLLGASKPEAERQMEEVFQFEKKLASIYERNSLTIGSQHQYQRITVGHLQSMCPAIPWLDYMNNMYSSPVQSEEEVIVYNPNYLKNMSELVIQTERRIVANYMVWHLIKPMLPMLSKPFRNAFFEFNSKETGSQAPADSKKSCVAKTDAVLGYATGHLFVKEMESKDKFSKTEVERILQLIKESFQSNIPQLAWMDSETKSKAIEKARSIFDMVAYPPWIKVKEKLDKFYEKLIVTDEPFTNYLRAREFYHERTMQRRGQLSDRTEWHIIPTVVNAFYNSPSNFIAFPVGILQPPFYDAGYPMSVNFGAIGTVIGHELTHGFDAQGRHFDKTGSLKSWWTNKSANGFLNSSKCIEQQYSKFDGAKAQAQIGKNDLIEDTADNGGLKIAYQAYKTYEYLNGAGKLLPGLKTSHDQMFFLGFAQVWCSKNGAEMPVQQDIPVQQGASNHHARERLRVDVAAANTAHYAKAFQCPTGSRMNPQHRCVVW